MTTLYLVFYPVFLFHILSLERHFVDISETVFLLLGIQILIFNMFL